MKRLLKLGMVGLPALPFAGLTAVSAVTMAPSPACQSGTPVPADPYPGTAAADTNFESGTLSPFTVFTAGTGTAAVSSAASHSPHCAAFPHATTDPGSIAKMSVGLTSGMKEAYADGWFNITTEGVSGNDNPYFRFFSGGIRYLDVFRKNVTGELVLRVTTSTDFTYITLVPNVQLGTWHHLVMHVVPNGAATGAQVWWDDKSVYANNAVNVTATSFETVQLGAEHDQQMGDIYADDVIINSGPETPGPVPGTLPTPTTTPTPTPGTGPGDWTEKLVAAGDVNGDGIPDLVQRQADGTLWLYPGDGTGGFGAGQRIGDFGWQAFDQVVGVGDYNGDGHPDLVARNLDGSLWLYAGTGRVDATSKGFAGGVKIGNFGWNVFDTILGVGDFDGDGHPGLAARKVDGTLWLYSVPAPGCPVRPVRSTSAGASSTNWSPFMISMATGQTTSSDANPMEPSGSTQTPDLQNSSTGSRSAPAGESMATSLASATPTKTDTPTWLAGNRTRPSTSTQEPASSPAATWPPRPRSATSAGTRSTCSSTSMTSTATARTT